MVVTVTLNPCIDRTMHIDDFQYGGLNRVVHTRLDVSGKGINVAKAVKQLGMDAICLGFNYQENKALLEEELYTYGIAYDFVNIPGRVRTNVKIFEQKSGVMTEFNEKGDYAGEEAVVRLLQCIETSAGDTYVLSGSVPGGISEDIYKRILQRLPGRQIILDAEKGYLRLGIEGCPTIIKPNLFELENCFAVELKSYAEIVMLCKKIIAKGVKITCISLGKDGALLVDEKKAYFAPALSIAIKGVQGAGDSLVAGICRALQERLSGADMLRYAMAAAGASLIREGTLMCTAEDFHAMLPMVEVREI